MAISYCPTIRVFESRIHSHSSQSSQPGRVPQKVIFLEQSFFSIFSNRIRCNELRFINRESRPLITLLGDYWISLNLWINWRFTSLNIGTDFVQPCPLPSLRYFKGNLVIDANNPSISELLIMRTTTSVENTCLQSETALFQVVSVRDTASVSVETSYKKPDRTYSWY